MQKLLLGLGVILVILVGAVLVLPSLIPAEVYREQLSRKISEATGRAFSIGGDVKLQVLPNIRVQIGQAVLANAPGGKAASMAEIGQLDVGLALLPLLSKRVEVTSFVLNDAVIHLEIDKSSKPNWEFETGATGSNASAGDDQDNSASLSELSLGDVRLVNGRVSYTDLKTGEHKELDNINATIELPSLDRPFALKGNALYAQQKIDLKIDVEAPRAALEGGASALRLTLDSKHLKASYDGNAVFGEALQLAGTTKFESPSVRELSAWLGSPIAGNDSGFGPLLVSGQMVLKGDDFSFSGAQLRFDEIKATGDVTGNFAGNVPYIKATLDTDLLDLRPYTASEGEAAGGGKSGGGSDEWSDEPIDASVLKAFNADISFKAKKMLVEDLSIGDSDLAIKIRNGVLTANLQDLTLYQGKAVGTLTIDGRKAQNQITSKLTLSNLVLEHFLKDAAKTERFEGIGSFTIDIKGVGRSQKDIISSLAGTAAITFKDGAIRGVDLAKVAQAINNLIGDDEEELDEAKTEQAEEAAEDAQGDGEKTKFVELTSHFAITNGILKTGDFKMISELLSLSGNGNINMGQQTIDFTLLPGSNQSDGGLKVGLRVKGPFSKPKITPDARGLIQNEISKALGDSPASQILNGLLGGGKKPMGENADEEEQPSAGETLLKGLFGQ